MSTFENTHTLQTIFDLDIILMIMEQSCLFVAPVASFAPCGTQATNKNMPSKSHVVVLLSIYQQFLSKSEWKFLIDSLIGAFIFLGFTTLITGVRKDTILRPILQYCQEQRHQLMTSLAVRRISLGRQTPLKSSNPTPQNFVQTGQKKIIKYKNSNIENVEYI